MAYTKKGIKRGDLAERHMAGRQRSLVEEISLHEGEINQKMSVKLAKIIEEFQFIADKLSTQTRTVALGIIAFIWIILTGKDALPEPFTPSSKGQLFIIGFLCLIILVFDFLQYLFSYFYTNSLINKTEADKKEEATYNYKDIRYKANNFFFISKIVVLTIAVLWLAFIVIKYIISAILVIF